MDLTTVAAMSTQMSQAGLLQQVGMAVMDMAMDSDKMMANATAELISSAPVPSLDPNVGTLFNASV